MIHDLIDILSKPCFSLNVCCAKKQKRSASFIEEAVKKAVIQQVSSESSGGTRQADKILITAEAQQPYLFYCGSCLLALTHPDNDPLSTGIAATCGRNNLFS